MCFSSILCLWDPVYLRSAVHFNLLWPCFRCSSATHSQPVAVLNRAAQEPWSFGQVFFSSHVSSAVSLCVYLCVVSCPQGNQMCWEDQKQSSQNRKETKWKLARDINICIIVYGGLGIGRGLTLGASALVVCQFFQRFALMPWWTPVLWHCCS